MKNKGYTLAGCGIVVALTTFAYFVLVDELLQFPMAILTLSTLLLSELVVSACLLLLPNALRSITLAVVYGIQTIVTAIIGSLFVNIFIFSYLGYLFTYILTFAIAALIALFILHNSSEAVTKNEAFRNAKNNTMAIRAMVNRMMYSKEGLPYQELLQRLDEDLRFMDDSQIDSMDAEIHNQICFLGNHLGAPNFDVNEAVANIRNLIQQRNFAVKYSKPRY